MHLLFIRKFAFTRENLKLLLIISIPFLLDILYIWNNDSIIEGFKHLEKRSSLLLLPLVILGYFKQIKLRRILKYYSCIFLLILNVLLLRFTIIKTDHVNKYINGKHLWEMGYEFANSTTVHAPALNMHVAFLVCTLFYLLITSSLRNVTFSLAVKVVMFLNSIAILLIINTRLAIVLAFVGLLSSTIFELSKKTSLRKIAFTSICVTIFSALGFYAFAKAFPYTEKKFTQVAFAHMDKVNKLDEIDRPEITVYSSLVTRVSIWNTALERAKRDIWLGVGAADGKDELNQAYIDTNQKFLAKYRFPTHNQYIDFLLKFGVLGLLGTITFMLLILYLGVKLKNSLIIFFFILFAASNLTDDFLIRYDGITFSALWLSIFSSIYLKQRLYKDQPIA
ncbi:hypothetical protein BST97_11215 [Nonlabens spongiae]|uniref:O-antigen ligase-related domain-containing protein n=2 Tax=Nonlabens spongiae TaxID=331648 RepID=A0A1W6MPC9_9FLAO|nr:hypothetical protein BST97_11215 [Nonlabens spongiae]